MSGIVGATLLLLIFGGCSLVLCRRADALAAAAAPDPSEAGLEKWKQENGLTTSAFSQFVQLAAVASPLLVKPVSVLLADVALL